MHVAPRGSVAPAPGPFLLLGHGVSRAEHELPPPLLPLLSLPEPLTLIPGSERPHGCCLGLAGDPDGALGPWLAVSWVPLPVPSAVMAFWGGLDPNSCFPGTLAAFLFPWPASVRLGAIGLQDWSWSGASLPVSPSYTLALGCGCQRGLCMVAFRSRAASQMERGC